MEDHTYIPLNGPKTKKQQQIRKMMMTTVIRVVRNHERIKTDPKSIKRKASIFRKSVWVERHRFPRTRKELEKV